MKKNAIKTLAILGFLCMFTAAPAYSQTQQLTTNIPFPFIADGKSLPAGTYRIDRIRKNSAGVLVLQEQNSFETAVVFTMPVQSTVMQEEAKLVFHRYGEEYFLTQIWSAGRNIGYELSESNTKRTIRRTLAKNSPKSEAGQTKSTVETVVLPAN